MALTKEDLMAISQVLDSRLDDKLTPIYSQLESINGRLDNVEDRLTHVGERLDCVEGRLTKIELIQENDMLPRLQNIESCYLSTFDRYQEHVSGYKTMESDIELLKKVVAAHF